MHFESDAFEMFKNNSKSRSKAIDNNRTYAASRTNHPNSALGFINNEQLRNRSSLSKYVHLMNSSKHQKHGVYNTYANMSKKKQPRASSNSKTSHMHSTKTKDYFSRSLKKKKKKKKNNILFKLANDLSQSPNTVKVKKAYSKESKKPKPESRSTNKVDFYKVFSGFAPVGDSSENVLNTEMTDNVSMNSSKNVHKTDFMVSVSPLISVVE